MWSLPQTWYIPNTKYQIRTATQSRCCWGCTRYAEDMVDLLGPHKLSSYEVGTTFFGCTHTKVVLQASSRGRWSSNPKTLAANFMVGPERACCATHHHRVIDPVWMSGKSNTEANNSSTLTRDPIRKCQSPSRVSSKWAVSEGSFQNAFS